MSSVHTVENAAENSPRKNRYHTGLLIAYRLDVLDAEILKIEQNLETVSDAYAEELKMKRVHLKDQLYKMLQENS